MLRFYQKPRRLKSTPHHQDNHLHSHSRNNRNSPKSRNLSPQAPRSNQDSQPSHINSLHTRIRQTTTIPHQPNTARVSDNQSSLTNHHNVQNTATPKTFNQHPTSKLIRRPRLPRQLNRIPSNPHTKLRFSSVPKTRLSVHLPFSLSTNAAARSSRSLSHLGVNQSSRTILPRSTRHMLRKHLPHHHHQESLTSLIDKSQQIFRNTTIMRGA